MITVYIVRSKGLSGERIVTFSKNFSVIYISLWYFVGGFRRNILVSAAGYKRFLCTAVIIYFVEFRSEFRFYKNFNGIRYRYTEKVSRSKNENKRAQSRFDHRRI